MKRKPCKALSGGGSIRGRGDFACSEANPHLQIQAPPPYKKKKELQKSPLALKAFATLTIKALKQKIKDSKRVKVLNTFSIILCKKR